MNKFLKLLLAGSCLAGVFGVPPSWGATNIVNMINNRFVPADLTIAFGDTVKWVNLERTQHDTVSGRNGIPSTPLYWKSRLFGIGSSFSVTFTNTPVGVPIPYYCTPHWQIGMIGTITVLPAPPNIISPTNGDSFTAGDTVVFEATVPDGNSNVASVDFFTNGNLIGAITNPPYVVTLTNVAEGNYELSAFAVDTQGVLSSTAMVSIAVGPPEAPSITSQPQSRVTRIGSTVEFTVVADGKPPPQYQWQLNDVPITAATNATYLISNVQTNDAGIYVVIVSNRVGSTNSQPATLELDSIRPTLAITNSPPDFTRINSPFVLISGTADDDKGVDHVEAQVNSGPFLDDEGMIQPAAGTTNWNARVALMPGNNAVRLRSVDLAGNISIEVIRFFTYDTRSQLTVTNRGAGTVTPNLTLQQLKIGQLYAIRAMPAFGYVFDGWDFGGLTGVGNSNNATLSFVMQPDLVLTANFIPNPFNTVNGTYTGLFFDTNSAATESSGCFTLRVGHFGAFSGRCLIDGRGYPLSGRFNNHGQTTTTVLRRQLVPVYITLNLDLTGGTGQISGNVSDGSWTAELLGNRNVFRPLVHPALQAGAYPFVFRRDDNSMVIGTNDVARINTAGQVSVRGGLNGRAFSVATALAQNGDCPLYVSLKPGSEAVIGWLRFPITPTSPYGTNLFWVKSGTNGFLLQLDAISAQP